MKKLTYLTAALATLAFAACSEADLDTSPLGATEAETPEGAITFSTNVGKSKLTRSGVTGSFNTLKLRGGDGFGVFAYVTEKETYENYRGYGNTPATYPNMMYNKQVTYNAEKDRWQYIGTQYWPNDIADADGGDVDDQENDHSNDPATGSGIGGKVSFFAYAPYVDVTQVKEKSYQGAKPGNTTGGIVALSGNRYNGSPSPYNFNSDPFLTYIIPDATYTDDEGNKGMVDLLWGTAGYGNGLNVVGQTNPGVLAKTYGEHDGDARFDTLRVNADLTKQTTKGTVNFAFKHALSKIGGSYTGNDGKGDDDNPSTLTNGLMVVLDIDKDGAELGGNLDDYTVLTAGGTLESDPRVKSEWNRYNTKVTINKIELNSSRELKEDQLAAFETARNSGERFDWTTYTIELRNQGTLNLASGVWSLLEKVGTSDYSQEVVPATGDPAEDAKVQGGLLSEEISEPADYKDRPAADKYTKLGYELLPIGVTTVPKNVYENEAQPFVFIPGTRPVITISVTYTVRSYDEKLADSYSEVTQKITKRLYITDPVQLNKQYNILMHLGLTSIKFEATVDDWDVATTSTGTTHDPETGEEVETFEEEVEHIWLPRNVGEPNEVAAKLKKSGSSNSFFAWDEANRTITASSWGSQAGDNYYELESAQADFGDGMIDVNTEHVVFTSDAAWIHTDGKKITVDDNILPFERTGIVKIWYDNVAMPVTVHQYGVVPSDLQLTVFDKNNTPVSDLTALPSGSDKYTTTLTYKYTHVTQAGAAWGSGVGTGNNTVSEGYVLSQTGDFVTISGTTFTTASNPSVDEREGTINVAYGQNSDFFGTHPTYRVDGTEQTIKQNGSQITALRLTVGGEDAVKNIASSAIEKLAYKLEARLEDSNGVDLGYKQDMTNADHINDKPASIKAKIDPDYKADTWIKHLDVASIYLKVEKNTGAKRSQVIQARINATSPWNKSGVELKSNEVTVTQASGL